MSALIVAKGGLEHRLGGAKSAEKKDLIRKRNTRRVGNEKVQQYSL